MFQSLLQFFKTQLLDLLCDLDYFMNSLIVRRYMIDQFKLMNFHIFTCSLHICLHCTAHIPSDGHSTFFPYLFWMDWELLKQIQLRQLGYFYRYRYIGF